MRDRKKYAPALLLAIGGMLLLSVQAQRTMALQSPLAGLDHPIEGYASRDLEVPEDQLKVGGFTSYLNRVYLTGEGKEVYGVFVGFFDSQQQGKTIHSPKNCLPGGGWEAMTHPASTWRRRPAVPVNRTSSRTRTRRRSSTTGTRARGRVAANEYLVKLDLLRDAALRRRTDEALVRLVIPVTPTMSEAQADELARRAAASLVPTLYQHLPA